MHTLGSDFLSLEIKSIAVGYRALQIVSKRNTIKVLEASAAGDRFLLLAIGASEELQTAVREVRESLDRNDKELLLDSEIVEACASEVIEAFFHLPQVDAQEAVVIVETETVSGLLASAQSLVRNSNLKMIEAKIKRSGGGAYGFFTGRSQDAAPGAEEVRTRLSRAMRAGRVELVENLTPGFRAQFNLSGINWSP